MVPYSFIKAWNKEESRIKKFDSIEEQVTYLTQPGNMEGQFLGECLDSIRWGHRYGTVFEMNTKELVGFIDNWMKQNEDDYISLWHERLISEIYKKLELPHINNGSCTIHPNANTILDRAGRVRCANKKFSYYKPSFVEEFELSEGRISFSEICPVHPVDILEAGYTEDEFEYKTQVRLYDKYINEPESLEVVDVCYNVISDKNLVLPLETIIDRLNVHPRNAKTYCRDGCDREEEISDFDRDLYNWNHCCPGHYDQLDKTGFNFGGWTLAFFVQKWWEQIPFGEALLFDEKKTF